MLPANPIPPSISIDRDKAAESTNTVGPNSCNIFVLASSCAESAFSKAKLASLAALASEAILFTVAIVSSPSAS